MASRLSTFVSIALCDEAEKTHFYGVPLSTNHLKTTTSPQQSLFRPRSTSAASLLFVRQLISEQSTPSLLTTKSPAYCHPGIEEIEHLLSHNISLRTQAPHAKQSSPSTMLLLYASASASSIALIAACCEILLTHALFAT